MKQVLAFVIISAIAGASSASESTTPESAPAAGQALPQDQVVDPKLVVTEADKRDRRICRVQQTTGSFVRTRKVCRTEVEWERLSRDHRDQMQEYAEHGRGGSRGN